MPMDCEPLYRDPRHYDRLTAGFTEDIPFYLGLVRRYGEPVLELGCGTGRLTVPIARKGHAVEGLDLSEAMLTGARERAAAHGVRIPLHLADCRNFDLGRRFRLILFPYNSFLHLQDRPSQEACLACVRRHLLPQGRFVLDVFLPDFEIITRDPEKHYPVAEYEDPDGQGTVTITETGRYDAVRQVRRTLWHYRTGNEQRQAELNVRILFPEELLALLHHNGFAVEERFGDFDGGPLTSGSPKQLVVAAVRE